jgi:putative Mn2+ efflux pump MntP
MLTSLFIAIALSMDSFAVSLSCCPQGGGKRLGNAAKIAASFSAFQAGIAALGFLMGAYFLPTISSFDHWLAFFILCYIGAKMVADSRTGKKCPAEKSLALEKLALLSFATSIDALAVGISFALLHLDAAITIALIAIVTFVLSFAGAYLSGRLREAFGNKAECFGGLLLIAIGAKILREHTCML